MTANSTTFGWAMRWGRRQGSSHICRLLGVVVLEEHEPLIDLPNVVEKAV
jgi:hypothetical protein